MRSVRSTRGQARQFWQVFGSSRVPMTVVDNDRVNVAANRPARLLFRLPQAAIIDRRIDDFTEPAMLPRLESYWTELMSRDSATGPYEVRFPDGSELSVVFCALGNVLPGQHLILFAPAAWPADELVDASDGEAAAPHHSLSNREREVLSLIAAGADRQEIADELTISVATVRTHVRNLLRKLKARNRAHAIALAIQHGLIDLESPKNP